MQIKKVFLGFIIKQTKKITLPQINKSTAFQTLVGKKAPTVETESCRQTLTNKISRPKNPLRKIRKKLRPFKTRYQIPQNSHQIDQTYKVR